MKSLVRGIDSLLRRANGVYEFCDEPYCVLRLQRTYAPHDLHLPDGLVKTGAPVLALHLWNDQVPEIPREGADLAWATKMTRIFLRSLHRVGDELRNDQALAEVQAVGALSTGVFGPEGEAGSRVFEQLGFHLYPCVNPLGRFGAFWENLYSWWLMWAFNAASLRDRHLLRMRRTEMWMSVAEFLDRYGARGARGAARTDEGLPR